MHAWHEQGMARLSAESYGRLMSEPGVPAAFDTSGDGVADQYGLDLNV